MLTQVRPFSAACRLGRPPSRAREKADHLVTCCEDGSVALFDANTQEFRKIITRCSLPTRHAAFSPDGKRIAVAEVDIKIVEVENVSISFVLQGQQTSTKSVAFHPQDKILVRVHLGIDSCSGGSLPPMFDGLPAVIGMLRRLDSRVGYLGDADVCQGALHRDVPGKSTVRA
ncbi:MAG: hypothetical protein BJ554DRAFT_1389 [Olpidium bornovanus]|uniref:Uncharacterized protein n=1 Tax=Olpidium bornovanus TaxID=278681 RepID=A0A8H7ZST7_9FUNG|nr:MAG: hypothetical protein BJ554DRAFT_1389 [Olpidium bornovanus]